MHSAPDLRPNPWCLSQAGILVRRGRPLIGPAIEVAVRLVASAVPVPNRFGLIQDAECARIFEKGRMPELLSEGSKHQLATVEGLL